MEKTGKFHLDCIMRCIHQFTLDPNTQDLTMSLMSHKGGLNKQYFSSLRYNMFSTTSEVSKFCRSLTFISLADWLLNQEFETRFNWIRRVIRLAQLKVVGVEFDGIPIWN